MSPNAPAAPPAAQRHSILADDLVTVLAAHKLRRWNGGASCQLATLTARPLVDTDCHRRPPTTSELANAKRMPKRTYLGPLQRGYIASLANRVQGLRGRAEVLRTWGVGIATLRREPAYVLNGGQP